MKKNFIVVIFSVLFFVIGAVFATVLNKQVSQAQNKEIQPEPSSTPGFSQLWSENNEVPKLLEDKFVTDFAGKKLNLENPTKFPKDYLATFIKDAKILPLKTHGMIVGFGDKIYKFDDKFQVIWTYEVAQWIIDFSFVESTNLIYGTAGDNIVFILNADTGKQLFINGRNGSAAYGVVQNYGEDTTLITDDFLGYREGSRYENYASLSDGIGLWQGTKELWHIDFPPDAELVVNDKRILAVTKTTAGIYIREITPPQKNSLTKK